MFPVNISNKNINEYVRTALQYPLTIGGHIDKEAGFKLIERMEKEQIEIPVIICSTSNYQGVAGILGSAWYRENDNDLGLEFKEVLGSFGCNLRCPFCQNHEMYSTYGCNLLLPEDLARH